MVASYNYPKMKFLMQNFINKLTTKKTNTNKEKDHSVKSSSFWHQGYESPF